MKPWPRYINEIGIAFSYISMLVACYLFDWEPFGVFISYLIEIVVLLGVYVVLRVQDQRKNPSRYRKSQSVLAVIVAVAPLVAFQYLLIGWMSQSIFPKLNFTNQNLLFTKEVFFAFVSLVVLYSVQTFQMKSDAGRLAFFQDNFLFKVLALTATNVLGFFLVMELEVHALLPVFTAMVLVRILLEIYFRRKMNLRI